MVDHAFTNENAALPRATKEEYDGRSSIYVSSIGIRHSWHCLAFETLGNMGWNWESFLKYIKKVWGRHPCHLLLLVTASDPSCILPLSSKVGNCYS